MCRNLNHMNKRCRCCDPAIRRARRHEAQMRQRGWNGDINPVFAAGKVSERIADASGHPEAAVDPSPTVRAARARRGHLAQAEQDSLAADFSLQVRLALASNRGLLYPVWDALISDTDPKVRARARARPTPASAEPRMETD